jgi:hypothetical protein
MGVSRVFGQVCLGLRYRVLFFCMGRASVLITPLAQNFMGNNYLCAKRLPMSL